MEINQEENSLECSLRSYLYVIFLVLLHIYFQSFAAFQPDRGTTVHIKETNKHIRIKERLKSHAIQYNTLELRKIENMMHPLLWKVQMRAKSCKVYLCAEQAR